MHELELKTINSIEARGIHEHPILGAASPDGRLYFHNIPKNASSFMNGQLSAMGWNTVTSQHQIPRHVVKSKGICILRDPVKRWISGIAEFLSHVYDEQGIDPAMDHVLPLLAHNPDMDAHTLAQSSFLIGHDLGWFDFAMMGEIKTVNATMMNYLYVNGCACDFLNHERENTTQGRPIKMRIRDIVKQKLKSDSDFAAKIRDYYSTDYALIDWVGRNQKWIPSI